MTSGPTGATGETGATGATGPAGSGDSAEFQLTLGPETLTDFDLAAECPGIKSGDIVAIVLTGAVVVDSIVPPSPGFWCWIGIRDNGGHTLTFRDANASGVTGAAANQFRTPGAGASDVGPNFALSTEEDWTAIGYTQISTIWRILAKNSAGTNSVLSVGGGGIPAPFDNTHSPVVVYNFQLNANDSSGNGLNLSGSVTYHELVAQCYALRQGSTLVRPSPDAALAIAGDVTIRGLGRRETTAAGGLLSFFASGETLATNIQYYIEITSAGLLMWQSESGAGVDATFTVTGTDLRLPPVGVIFEWAAVRESNVVTFYLNGLPWGTSSSALTAPTGGTSSVLNVGLGSTNYSHARLAIYNGALTAAQLKALYNLSMGPAFGLLS